ncbi:hypothetical protein T492DRAFT_1039655 [Pavlovales sp. CCMP2436]|nr:hypothetical protein T492DRAFT_1039655 [Pavlovales sp. CCMP2436]
MLHLPARAASANDVLAGVMGHVNQSVGPGTKRAWTLEEDCALTALVQLSGPSGWAKLADEMRGDRTGKQCRERWFHHLAPDVKKGDWTEAEDLAILEAVAEIGPCWTDHAIKNRYNSTMRRNERTEAASCKSAAQKEREGADFGGSSTDQGEEIIALKAPTGPRGLLKTTLPLRPQVPRLRRATYETTVQDRTTVLTAQPRIKRATFESMSETRDNPMLYLPKHMLHLSARAASADDVLAGVKRKFMAVEAARGFPLQAATPFAGLEISRPAGTRSRRVTYDSAVAVPSYTAGARLERDSSDGAGGGLRQMEIVQLSQLYVAQPPPPLVRSLSLPYNLLYQSALSQQIYTAMLDPISSLPVVSLAPSAISAALPAEPAACGFLLQAFTPFVGLEILRPAGARSRRVTYDSAVAVPSYTAGTLFERDSHDGAGGGQRQMDSVQLGQLYVAQPSPPLVRALSLPCNLIRDAHYQSALSQQTYTAMFDPIPSLPVTSLAPSAIGAVLPAEAAACGQPSQPPLNVGGKPPWTGGFSKDSSHVESSVDSGSVQDQLPWPLDQSLLPMDTVLDANALGMLLELVARPADDAIWQGLAAESKALAESDESKCCSGSSLSEVPYLANCLLLLTGHAEEGLLAGTD